MNRPLARISDDDLIRRLKFFVRDERGRMVQVIAHLAEGEARGLFTKLGFSSSRYCRDTLHFSEHEAYLRICAARCALRFPVILKQLAEGSVNLTTVRLLSPHLTEDNHLELLAEARHKSKFQVKEMVARLDPQAPVPPSVWELPQVSPLAPNLYKIEFTAGLCTYEKLRQFQALVRHRVPTGDIGVVFDVALTMALDVVTTQRIGSGPGRQSNSVRNESNDEVQPDNLEGPAKIPEASALNSRYIPKAVRSEVWQRDEGQCAYLSPAGERCPSRDWLEFHHVKPYAWGGSATTKNLELRCRTHNAFEGAQLFGPRRRVQRE